MEELDEILLEQLNAARRQAKIIKRLKKVISDNDLDKVEKANHLRQKFFENMISDKSLLVKKKSKKRKKSEDILDRSLSYNIYRNTFMATAFMYMYFAGFMKNYWSQYRRKKEE